MAPCRTQRSGIASIAAAEGLICGQLQIDITEQQRLPQHVLTSVAIAAARQPASQWRFTGHALHNHLSESRSVAAVYTDRVARCQVQQITHRLDRGSKLCSVFCCGIAEVSADSSILAAKSSSLTVSSHTVR